MNQKELGVHYEPVNNSGNDIVAVANNDLVRSRWGIARLDIHG